MPSHTALASVRQSTLLELLQSNAIPIGKFSMRIADRYRRYRPQSLRSFFRRKNTDARSYQRITEIAAAPAG